MDATQILTDRIQHEIDMEILIEIGEKVGADLTKEIELAEKKLIKRSLVICNLNIKNHFHIFLIYMCA
jgi:hypothetical protein